MAKIEPWQLKELFNPTIRHIEIDKWSMGSQSLKRKGKWSTNGYWLILSSLEPKFLGKYKEEPKNFTIEMIERPIKEAKAVKKMELTNHVLIHEDKPLIKLETANHHTWVNAYFISLFLNATKEVVEFWQSNKSTGVIVVKTERGEIIGAVMPVKLWNEEEEK